MSTKKLTPKQQRFVEEYLVDLNAAAAAVRAGYSEKTAKEIGHENLTKPHIAEKIRKAMEERSERTGVTADMVVEELAKLGFSDMRRFATWGPKGVTLLDSEDLEEGDAACVSEVTMHRTFRTGVDMPAYIAGDVAILIALLVAYITPER